MILKILIGIGAVFALYLTIKTKKTFPTIITLGMIAGITLALFLPKTIQIYGFYIYMGFVSLAFIYGLTVKDKNIKERLTICLMSLSIFVYWLWVLNHWHGNAVLAPTFALLVATGGIISKVKLKNELGFMTLLLVDTIVILIENWMKAN